MGINFEHLQKRKNSEMASELFKEASKYFSLDSLDKDNWAFKLFSKVTVGIFMGSAALSLASSYSGDAIVCKDGDDYDKQYCWLHGSRQRRPEPGYRILYLGVDGIVSKWYCIYDPRQT